MQRNGQNPIKSVSFSRAGGTQQTGENPLPHQKGGTVPCPSCKTEVQPKPGFRLSALKCPKCGASMMAKK